MSARTITARIDPQAITRVTRFFNAGLRQTLEELLQNARRSGATEVDIWVDGDLLTIADDGTGIDDPSSLLAFGASTWNDEAVQREDPAGMGVYALAPRPCAIASKAAEGDGWRVALEPKHFRGDAPAVIEPCAMPERGTAVTLTLLGGETEQTVKDVVEAAGRHHPLPIVFNGNPVEREDFLRGSAATTEWEGVRIGVFADGTRATLNFHGIEIRLTDAPYVRTMERGWSAAVDVIDAPGLELTLPARQELVQNDLARRLRKRMHKAIYETLRGDEAAAAAAVRELARGAKPPGRLPGRATPRHAMEGGRSG